MTTPSDFATRRDAASVGALEFRRDLETLYADIYTPDVKAALYALAPLDADRQALMAARIARRADRARDRARITFLDPAARLAARPSPLQDARDGAFAGSEIPRDLQRQWIQGTGPAAKPGRAVGAEHPQRRLRAAVGRRRLDVRRRGRARPGVDDVARQPAEPEAGDPSRRRCSCAAAEQVAGEMNRWAAGLLRPPDRRRLAGAARLHDDHLPRPRPAPRRSARPPRPTAPASRPRSSTPSLYVVNNQARCAAAARRIVLYLPKIQTAEEAALWNDILIGARAPSGLPPARSRPTCSSSSSRPCFQLMEIRAALGAAFRRLQHRPLGLHQQRVRCDGLGSRRSSIRTSTRSR